MKTSAALLPLLVTLAGACVITSSPPPPTDGTPPPPPPTNAVPPPPATTPAATPTTTTPVATTTSTPTTPVGTVTPPKGEGKGTMASLIGSWVSPSCGARTYVRKIEFARGATFDAQDLVSPCPPKTQCIWSGIVSNHGTYSVESGMIKLVPAQPGGNPRAQPLPVNLAIDPVTSAPMETQDGAKCVYTKDTAKP